MLELEAFAQPDSLSALCAAVRNAEAEGWSVHAMGSAWAFSAPAYCPGMVIRTDKLNKFPAAIQEAINKPESGHTLLVAVEAGIKIRDLYLALAEPASLLPVMEVTVAPARQRLETPVTLTVAVRSSAGEPIVGATVKSENFDQRGFPAEALVFTTDPTGVVTFPITFNAKKEFDPLTHELEEVGLPSAR